MMSYFQDILYRFILLLVLSECFHIFICQSSFEVCSVWHTIEAENFYLLYHAFVGFICTEHFFFFYKANSHLCICVNFLYRILWLFVAICYIYLWKENKLFSRVSYCFQQIIHKELTGNHNVYILHVNTCTNTDSLGGPKESPGKKSVAIQPEERRKQSGDDVGTGLTFLCFSIATLKTSHKLLPRDRSCLSIARLAFAEVM